MWYFSCWLDAMDIKLAVLLFQFSHSVVPNSLPSHLLQHTRLPCTSLSPRVCSNSCPLSWWYHPTMSSCCLLLLLTSIFPNIMVISDESTLPIRWPNTGASASASVLPMNIQHWFPLGLTGLISLQSKGLSNTPVQKHPFFSAQISVWSNSHIHAWLLEKP